MNDITLFEGNSQVPAHLAHLYGASSNTDLVGGLQGGYPIISYKGKVWHIVEGDKRTLVTNDDGEAKGSIEGVILKANPHLSKLYYQSGYEEGSNEKPTCYSNDGLAPPADVQDRQSDTCATCPHNVWGSRISENGAKGRACSDLRRLAFAPLGALDMPMLLRVPAATLKELAAYATMLDRRKTLYQTVVTKISFDHTVAHQKFLFKAVRFIDAEEYQTITEVGERDIINQIIGLSAAAGAPAEPEDALGATPAHLQKANGSAPATAGKPRAAAARLAVSEAEVDAAVAQATQPAPAKVGRPATVKPAPAAKPVVAAAKPAVAKPVSKPAATASQVKPQYDTAALMAEADASLDEALAQLDG
jgi:hypothetical protein